MTIWQQLGAWISTGSNIGDRLERLKAVGGSWAVAVTINDTALYGGVWNQEHFDEVKTHCQQLGLRYGVWANYFGEDPSHFAWRIAAFANQHDANPVILDCETSVQGSDMMSRVALQCRRAMPTRNLAVTTNSLNDSVVYNGRIDDIPKVQWQSFRRLGIRVMPQWYTSYQGGSRPDWANPIDSMQWLQLDGGTSDNLRDDSYQNKRAVPLSFVHGVLEATGVEGSDLSTELQQLHAAKRYGYTMGWSVYVLENMPDSDFDLIAKEKGVTFI